ncbi:MAG: 3-deoxy-manno-octulosonate cytidylyltransferase [Bacteroidota bacterium]
MRTVAIIPARYASTRFPGKPLADLGGKSIIQRVYEAVAAAEMINQVIVATDDDQIFDHVQTFGGEVTMTSPNHPSGTDRIAAVARKLSDADVIVNVQGDEPFVTVQQLAALLNNFVHPHVSIATLARRIDKSEDLLSPNVVKVVKDARGKAIYFSRHAIPFLRDLPLGQWLTEGAHYQHLGLYAYRKNTLLELTGLPNSTLEQQEKLEQLRWLSAGYNIYVAETKQTSIGIDTPADLERARNYLETMEGRDLA